MKSIPIIPTGEESSGGEFLERMEYPCDVMIQGYYRVENVREIAPNIFVLGVLAPQIASIVRAGQFVNIKTSNSFIPLLRRPFSIYRVDGEQVEIIFSIVGQGTQNLSMKKKSEMIDILGPLGNSYGVEEGFDHALLIAGGLGVAPLPLLTAELRKAGKNITTLLGARNKSQLVTSHLDNVSVATDDGSMGFHGTVVDLLRTKLPQLRLGELKIFSCGPTPMLRSLSRLAADYSITAEASLEGPMACGIGICQGCPVELQNGETKYALVCREGTVFPTNAILL